MWARARNSLPIPVMWPLWALPWEPTGRLLSVHSPMAARVAQAQGFLELWPGHQHQGSEFLEMLGAQPGALLPLCVLTRLQAPSRSASLSGLREALDTEELHTQKSGPFRCVTYGPVPWRRELGCMVHFRRFAAHA